jgi:hypothetical protein
MSEFVIKFPGVRIDEASKAELIEDIRSLVRLRVARDMILKRSDRLLRESALSDEDCEKLSSAAEKDIVVEWRKRGWL